VIHLRGYGQRDPLNEYKTEGFTLFEAMIARLREMTTAQVMRVEIQQGPAPDDLLPDEDDLPPMMAHHIDAFTGEDDAQGPMFGGAGRAAAGAGAMAAVLERPEMRGPKVGRNEPCPCGSGKKYKHCHGAYA
jgi:preprotein translocase subunit SecA